MNATTMMKLTVQGQALVILAVQHWPLNLAWLLHFHFSPNSVAPAVMSILPSNGSENWFLLSIAVLAFTVFCPDCWDSFLTSFPISGPALWPACPPLCHGLLSLNHRHDVFHLLQIFPQVSLALERVYTPKHGLQGAYDQMDLSSCPLPSPNLMFILYS